MYTFHTVILMIEIKPTQNLQNYVDLQIETLVPYCCHFFSSDKQNWNFFKELPLFLQKSVF